MKKEPLKFFRVFSYAMPLSAVQLPIKDGVFHHEHIAHAIANELQGKGFFATLHGSSDNIRWQSIPRDYSIELPF